MASSCHLEIVEVADGPWGEFRVKNSPEVLCFLYVSSNKGLCTKIWPFCFLQVNRLELQAGATNFTRAISIAVLNVSHLRVTPDITCPKSLELTKLGTV